MSRPIRIRAIPLLLTLSLLASPALAAGAAGAAPNDQSSPKITTFFASLWQGLENLVFRCDSTTADEDSGPGWDPWSPPNGGTPPSAPDLGPDLDPWG